MNSRGNSSGSSGIFVRWAATNCYGLTSHTVNTSHGIRSIGTVTNSYGLSNGSGGGDGINAEVVTGSYGNASAGARHGIASTHILESSRGFRNTNVAGKFGIQADRASLSRGFNGENIMHRYNMP